MTPTYIAAGVLVAAILWLLGRIRQIDRETAELLRHTPPRSRDPKRGFQEPQSAAEWVRRGRIGDLREPWPGEPTDGPCGWCRHDRDDHLQGLFECGGKVLVDAGTAEWGGRTETNPCPCDQWVPTPEGMRR